MIYTIPNFITEDERELILQELSKYYRKPPSELDHLSSVETAFGFDPNSKNASFWSIENPLVPYKMEEPHDSALVLLYNIYKKVQQELENTYKKKFRLVNIILNKMLTGSNNGLHTDDQPGFDDPVHTCLIYLSGNNKDFTGGELYFHTENKTIKPDRSMLVFFEGNTERPHEVLEILSGVRENITLQFTINTN
jgi:hypothetical protein